MIDVSINSLHFSQLAVKIRDLTASHVGVCTPVQGVSCWGGCREGFAPPAKGVRGLYPRKNFEISHSKSCILVHFWMIINVYLITVLVMVAIQSIYVRKI